MAQRSIQHSQQRISDTVRANVLIAIPEMTRPNGPIPDAPPHNYKLRSQRRMRFGSRPTSPLGTFFARSRPIDLTRTPPLLQDIAGNGPGIGVDSLNAGSTS